jgi:hypothetical protein
MSNWANRTKENLQTVAIETAPEEVLVNVGGGFEPITMFYRYKEPVNPTKSPYTVLVPGQVIQGEYVGSYISDQKYKKPTHKVRTEAGIVGLPSAGSIDKALAKVAEGAIVRITYNGKTPMKGGQYAGTPAHGFTVAASKLKQA